jgi:hypothetical protein
MRSLSETLLAAMKQPSQPRMTCNLTLGASSYDYTFTRIRKQEHIERPWSHTANVSFDNSDKAFDAINYKGYTMTLGWGYQTSAGVETSTCAPLKVIDQKFEDTLGKPLLCHLKAIGIPDLLSRDHASATYMPDDTNTDTIKTILNAIAGATLACFNHCEAYTVDYVSEDALIDVVTPKSSFRVYKGQTRLSRMRWLLDHTGCVMRFGNDGHLKIMVPTTE